jgi:hypothetical protein
MLRRTRRDECSEKEILLEETMVRPLTLEDVRDFLTSFAAAIELDQTRVDGLPSEKFHPEYSASMWRKWRRCHIEYIDHLLQTVNCIPSSLLQELTQLAISYEPPLLQEILIDLFGDSAGGMCAEEQFETATLFFGWVIAAVRSQPASKQINGDARALMMQWLDFTDPLRISEDPECGYGRPAGFVS